MRAPRGAIGEPRPCTPTSGLLIELLFMMSVGAAATFSALAVSLGARKGQDAGTRATGARDARDDGREGARDEERGDDT